MKATITGKAARRRITFEDGQSAAFGGTAYPYQIWCKDALFMVQGFQTLEAAQTTFATKVIFKSQYMIVEIDR